MRLINMDIFKIFGVLGLVMIIFGILIKSKNRKLRDILYILGGLALLAYSVYINDTIFIILQIVFILVAIYDFYKIKFFKKKR